MTTDFTFFSSSFIFCTLCLCQRPFELLGEEQGKNRVKKGGVKERKRKSHFLGEQMGVL